MTDNPHTTLQVILEPAPTGRRVPVAARWALAADARIAPGGLLPSASYSDLFYSLHPNRLLCAKRLVILLPGEDRSRLAPEWIDQSGRYATLV